MSEFSEKLKTLQFSTAGFVTREKKNYYDSDTVNDAWGDDAKDKMLDDTQGLGAIKNVDGVPYRRDYKEKEWVKVSEKELDQVYLGGSKEEEG